MESLGLRSLTKQTIATAGKSITGDGTPVDPLQLVNDEINPGNSEYYGTDASGIKGFFPIGGAGGTPSDLPALPLGVSGAPGVSTELSRYDHVHPYPTPTQIGAQTSSANLTAFAVYVPGDFAFAATSITAGTGLTGGGDLSANRTISVVNDTTIQQIQVLNAGTTVGARSMLNFIGGGTLTVATSANPSGNRIDVLLSATGGAGGTNLGVANITATTLDITSDTGSDATVPAATSIAAGLLTATLKSQYDNNVPQIRTLTAGTGLTGGGDLTTNRSFAVVNDTTIQQIQVLNAGTTVGARSMLNITAGGAIQVATSANPAGNRIDINVSAPVVNTALFALAATSIVAGTGLTGGGDLSANRTISVVNDTTIQQIQVLNAGTTVGARSMLNFISGGSLAISTSANPSGNRVDVLISAATGGSSTPLSNTPAVSLGTTASAGVATEASRQDHVHPMPSAGDVGAQPANSNLSALSGVSGSSEGFAYFSSPTAMSVAPSLPFGRGFLNILNTGAARTYIGAAEAAVSIIAGTGLTGGGDLTTSRTLAVVPDSTVQRVQVQKAGVTTGERPFLNFTEGGAVQVNVSANPSGNRIDINVSAPIVNTALFALAATSIVAGTGLTGGGDLSANRTISVVNDTTIQQIQVLNAGTTVGARSMLNIIGSGAIQVSTSANPSSNRIDITVSAPSGGSVPSYLYTNILTFVVDGGVSAVTTGIKGDIWVPFTCSVSEWTLLADQTGSIQWDIWSVPYSNYPASVGNTITGSAKPLISSGIKGQSTTLTGWGTSIASGSTLRFNIDSCTSIQRCTLVLRVDKK